MTGSLIHPEIIGHQTESGRYDGDTQFTAIHVQCQKPKGCFWGKRSFSGRFIQLEAKNLMAEGRFMELMSLNGKDSFQVGGSLQDVYDRSL